MGTATSFGGAVANGALVGASGGFAGGFVGGACNAWMGGASFGQGLQSGLIGGGYGALGGALIGGISGGIQYQRQISVFQKGCVDLGVNGGDPVPAKDQFLSDAQKAWYKDAPMNNVKAFTVENVPDNIFVGDNANGVGCTVPLSGEFSGKLTGMSNVYFNKVLAFSSAKQLFFTMGHEFVHVSQFAALSGAKAFLVQNPDFKAILDFHAYSYQNSLGGLKFSSYTKDKLIGWATTYPQFQAMNYINFPWTSTHSFTYILFDMKTKEVLIVLVLSLFSNLLAFPQFISIELSVKWTNGYDIFKEDSVICFPELSITYRNNSDSNFYFRRVSDSRKGNPMLPWGTFIQYPVEEYLNPDYKKRAIFHFDYTNNNYTVKIGGSQLYSEGWIVYNDNLNMEDEQPIDYINDDLADIYYYMFHRNYGKDTISKMYFLETEIGNSKIDDTVKNAFIFLKPKETYTDTYSLIAFKELGGNFTFQLWENKLSDYVLVNPIWDKNQARFLEQRIPLPKEVGDYKLYSGNFHSNKITIAL